MGQKRIRAGDRDARPRSSVVRAPDLYTGKQSGVRFPPRAHYDPSEDEELRRLASTTVTDIDVDLAGELGFTLRGDEAPEPALFTASSTDVACDSVLGD